MLACFLGLDSVTTTRPQSVLRPSGLDHAHCSLAQFLPVLNGSLAYGAIIPGLFLLIPQNELRREKVNDLVSAIRAADFLMDFKESSVGRTIMKHQHPKQMLTTRAKAKPE